MATYYDRQDSQRIVEMVMRAIAQASLYGVDAREMAADELAKASLIDSDEQPIIDAFIALLRKRAAQTRATTVATYGKETT